MTVDVAAIAASRLTLVPLRVEDAIEMVDVLADPELYLYTGGQPPTLEELVSRYISQTRGSGRLDEVWLNWTIQLNDSKTLVGFVQATVVGGDAELAWVVGKPWQRIGVAYEASLAVLQWLRVNGILSFCAHIHPDHRASEIVAEKIGLRRTSDTDDQGEVVWRLVGP